MTSPSPLWEDIFLSIRAVSKLVAAYKHGFLLSALALHHLPKPQNLNPTENPALFVALLVAYSYGYLKLPDTSPIGDFTKPSASKGSGASLFLVGLVAYQFLGFRPDWTNLDPSHSPVLAATLVIAYAYGYLKLPEINFTGDNPELSEFRKALPAIKAVAKRAEPYFKFGLLAALVTYLPIYHGLQLPLQPWLHIALLASVAVIGYIVPTTKFHGPARFGYLEYADHISRLYELLDWRVFVGIFLFLHWVFSYSHTVGSTLLPTISLGLIAISLSAWIHLYVEYRKQLLTITHQVATDMSRINTAASSTNKFAAEVSGYDRQLFTAATMARRDSIKATTTRITDFFVCGSVAWAKFAEITEAAREITSKTEAVVEEATNVEDTEKPDEVPDDDDANDDDEVEESQIQVLSRELREQAEAASETVAQVLIKVEAAQAKVRECENAQSQDRVARARAESNAKAASSAVVALRVNLTESLNQSLAVAAGAEKAGQFADQAVTAAKYGEMAAARFIAISVAAEASTAEASAEKGCRALDAARGILLAWLQAK